MGHREWNIYQKATYTGSKSAQKSKRWSDNHQREKLNYLLKSVLRERQTDVTTVARSYFKYPSTLPTDTLATSFTRIQTPLAPKLKSSIILYLQQQWDIKVLHVKAEWIEFICILLTRSSRHRQWSSKSVMTVISSNTRSGSESRWAGSCIEIVSVRLSDKQ